MYFRFLGATISAIALVLALTSCDDKNPLTQSTPPVKPLGAPTPPVPASPFGPATAIALGQPSTATVHASDPACKELTDLGYYYAIGGPCLRFLVEVPGAGTLRVHMEWAGADAMLTVTGRVAPYGPILSAACCSSPLDQTYKVSASGTFLIFVAWSGNRSGSNLTDSAQDFTLTPSFSPLANAERGGAK